METAGSVLSNFYSAVARKDLAAARRYVDDRLVFHGLFETYRSADQYFTALTGLLGITIALEVKVIVSEGADAAVFFELQIKAPVTATTLVAEWHQVKEGKIFRVRSAFDGRPFAAMFGAYP